MLLIGIGIGAIMATAGRPLIALLWNKLIEKTKGI